jgi:predicted nucleic acid-binding protein
MIDAGIVDTNVFLRHFLKDEPEQARQSSAFLGRIRRGEVSAVLLPTAVLEIIFILERQYSATRDEVFTLLSEILELRELDVADRAQLIDAANVYRERRGISFADAYHCAMARDFHGGSIISFDRKLNGIPGVTRKDPDEV